MYFRDLKRDEVFCFAGGDTEYDANGIIRHVANGNGTYDDGKQADLTALVMRQFHAGRPLLSIRALAVEALAIQNASNFFHVVRSFARALPQLRKNLELFRKASGAEEIAKHPISVLYADKIHSLTGAGFLFPGAYEKCRELALDEKPMTP